MRTIKSPLEILDELEKDKTVLGVQETELAIKAMEKYHRQFEDPFKEIIHDFMVEEKLCDDGYYGSKKEQSLELSEILLKFAHTIK